MERKLTGQSNKSSTSSKNNDRGASGQGVSKKQVTSQKAQEILDQLDADVAKQSEYSDMQKKSKTESFYDDDGEGSDGFEDVRIKGDDLIFNPESHERKWLRKHGKDHCIVFKDEELLKLREYFTSLDDDQSGSIGVDELEDPLIALGLVENRQQVQQIVQLVDEDGSEKIEFGEFLSIIKGGAGSKPNDGKQQNETGAIYDFFKKLTAGEFKLKDNDNAPFQLFISGYRRKMILESMMSGDGEKKRNGEKILENYKKQLADRMAREKIQMQATNQSMNKAGSTKRSSQDEFRMKRLQTYNSNDVPDPEVLKQILESVKRTGPDYIKELQDKQQRYNDSQKNNRDF